MSTFSCIRVRWITYEESFSPQLCSRTIIPDRPPFYLLQEHDFTNSSMASTYGIFLCLLPTVLNANFAQIFFSSTTFRFFSFPPFAILQMSRSSKGSGCWRSIASYTSYLRFCSNEWPSQVLTSSSVRFSSSTLTGWASLFFCNADHREKTLLIGCEVFHSSSENNANPFESLASCISIETSTGLAFFPPSKPSLNLAIKNSLTFWEVFAAVFWPLSAQPCTLKLCKEKG